jgi:putative zinc finger/helix-turn-helix YgiT family protein
VNAHRKATLRESELYRCESCNEGFFAPEQMKTYERAVKNEIRKKYGLLSPDRITEIRKKVGLTQEELERLLGTGQKVVVRWESGKVIQGSGHDNMLRLIERDPKTIEILRQIQQRKAGEEARYKQKHPSSAEGLPPHAKAI